MSKGLGDILSRDFAILQQLQQIQRNRWKGKGEHQLWLSHFIQSDICVLVFVLFLFQRLVIKIVTFVQTLAEVPTPFRDLPSHQDLCICWSYFASSQSFCKNSCLKHFMNSTRINSRCLRLHGESCCGIIRLPPATPFYFHHSCHRYSFSPTRQLWNLDAKQ